jgi:ankyrin repeat protein
MAEESDQEVQATPAGLLAGGSSEEEEENTKMSQDDMDKGLLQAVKEDDFEKVYFFLREGAATSYEADGWNALLWAARNGNEDIVRELIGFNAHTPYLNSQADSGKNESGDQAHEDTDAFRKPQDASKTGKYTPLHWASYNGHVRVVSILLKRELSPTEIDMYGNTSVHQAAAGGTDKVLKCFLMGGVDVNQENARSHSPLDLATNESTRNLILKAMNTLRCSGTICGNSVFDFKNIRYFCESCE